MHRCSSSGPAGSGGCATGEEELRAGDVRLVGDDGCSAAASGELQTVLLPDYGWSSICYEGFGYLDGQVACEQLGFAYVSSMYEITEPFPSSAPFAITNVACSPPLGFLDCSHIQFPASVGCSSTVGLSCNSTQTSEEYALIVVGELYYGRYFTLISPADQLYIENLVSRVPYCYGSHYLQRDDANVMSLLSGLRQLQARGDNLAGEYFLTNFGVNCDPVYGETVIGNFDFFGTVYLYTDEFIGVCIDTFGYLEAQVSCTRIDYPFASDLYAVDRLADPLQVVSSLECRGNETSIAQCEMQFANVTACQQVAAVRCAGEELGQTEGLSLLVFDSVPPYSFTFIVPDEDIYLHLQDCNLLASNDGNESFCPGAHVVSSNNSLVEQMILIANSTAYDAQNCSDFSNISNILTFDLLGIVCPTVLSTTTADVETTSTSVPGSAINSATVSGAIVAVLVAILILGAVLITVIAIKVRRHRRYKRATLATRNLMAEIVETDATKKKTASGDISRYIELRKQHKNVCRRKSSATNRIPNSDWEIPFACITLEEEVGAGAYGSIHRGVIACQHQQTPIEVAVKLLKENALESERRSLKLEIDMMKDIGYHRHVVSMLACCTRTQHLALVMEFIPFGNLQGFLKKHRKDSEDVSDGRSYNKYTKEFTQSDKGPTSMLNGQEAVAGALSLVELLQFARQITLGMEYLSSLKIVHRDLAARNILIDSDMILKVSDFGLSRDIYSDDCYHMESVKDRLPVRWMAVESIMDREFTTASDVWSFGITLWEIMTYASFPYCHLTNMEVIESIKKGDRMPLPENCPDHVYAIMTACWQSRPSLRPSFTDMRAMLDAILDTGEYMCLLDSNN